MENMTEWWTATVGEGICFTNFTKLCVNNYINENVEALYVWWSIVIAWAYWVKEDIMSPFQIAYLLQEMLR